jgi:hypothetical protein
MLSIGGRQTGPKMRIFARLIIVLMAFGGVGCATPGGLGFATPRHLEFTSSNVARLRLGETTEDQAKAIFGEPDQVEVKTEGQGSGTGAWQALVLSYRMGVEDPAFQGQGIEAVNSLTFQAESNPPILNNYEVPIIYP